MEFKNFLKLIKTYLATFITLFLIVFFTGLLIYDYQNKLYNGNVAVNISREASLKNQKEEFQYDYFYRLQADEKFGKNVISWVGDPKLMNQNKVDFEKIKRSNWEDISKVKAVQQSPNYVRISFKSQTPQSAMIFGKVLGENLIDKAESLNESKKNDNWFKLVVDETQISKTDINIYLVLIFSSLLGILVGIFGVLIMNYFSCSDDDHWN